jgi:CDP-glycerol glycerophosphotransferase
VGTSAGTRGSASGRSTAATQVGKAHRPRGMTGGSRRRKRRPPVPLRRSRWRAAWSRAFARVTALVPAALRLGLLQVLLHRLPTLQHAVVAGNPDDEGNSVEVVRGLADRIKVYWLVHGEPDSLAWMIDGVQGIGTVTCLRRNSFRAFWAYITARYVFFTHGLYGSLSPPRGKIFVNLWHGDGPKRRNEFTTVRSTFVVAGTQLWGAQRVKEFGVDERHVLITGNPRVDQFSRPADDDELRALGFRPDVPFVLWMPTFRRTQHKEFRLGPVRNWSDADVLSQSTSTQATLAQAVRESESLGMTFAVKLHHLDADEVLCAGMHSITTEGLRSAQIGLYQLLARARGLITDYSSVWTDFLILNRPIGFYCPDLRQFVAGRGLNVDDYPSLLPGPLLATPEDFRTFLCQCVQEPAHARARRLQAIHNIGLETRLGATNRLLDALGVGRGSAPDTAGSSERDLSGIHE